MYRSYNENQFSIHAICASDGDTQQDKNREMWSFNLNFHFSSGDFAIFNKTQ